MHATFFYSWLLQNNVRGMEHLGWDTSIAPERCMQPVSIPPPYQVRHVLNSALLEGRERGHRHFVSFSVRELCEDFKQSFSAEWDGAGDVVW